MSGVPDRVRATRFPPGTGTTWSRPGDIVLVCGTSWRDCVVRLFQRLLAVGRDGPRTARWTHAALVVGTNGAIVEVAASGVVHRNLRKYRSLDYAYVAISADPRQRRLAMRYAAARVGSPYSRLGFAGVVLAGLTKGWIRLPSARGDVCATLVARALACAGETFDKRPCEMLPLDLARHFAVTIR